MIKFVHKKHLNKTSYPGKITVYFSASDIFLGLLLVILVGFFIYNYMANANDFPSGRSGYYTNPEKSLLVPSAVPASHNNSY